MTDVVLKSCREPGGSVAHALLDELRHIGDLFLGGGAIVVPSHHLKPHSRVTDKCKHVDGGRLCLALCKVISDWPRRTAVRSHCECGDALRHLADYRWF